MKAGYRVRMSANLKRKLVRNDSGDHVKEFGDCIGIVIGFTEWSSSESGPEVDVRWLPSNLRYAYHPSDLEEV